MIYDATTHTSAHNDLQLSIYPACGEIHASKAYLTRRMRSHRHYSPELTRTMAIASVSRKMRLMHIYTKPPYD